MAAQLKYETPRRWSAQRKAEVVGAVSSGALSMDEAREAYAISEEEFLSWQDSLQANGVAGLRISAPERRKTMRRSVREAAVAVFNGFSRADCTIKDIGDRGARLEFKAVSVPPNLFVLKCARTKRSTWVSVVWRQDRTVGVRFELPPSADAMAEPASGAWLLGEI